jgi:hypothetical protein
MIGRGGKILFIVWQMAWLNVIVPGHTRGAVTLPSGSGVRVSCCSSDGAKSNPTAPTSGQRARCAICYFAAGLSAPTFFSTNLNFLRLRQAAPLPQISVPVLAYTPLPYFPCGPPVQPA